MKKKNSRNSEMTRPQTRVCWFCDRKVEQSLKICPKCGRLLTRNLKEMEWEDFIEMDVEPEIRTDGQKIAWVEFNDVPEAREAV